MATTEEQPLINVFYARKVGEGAYCFNIKSTVKTNINGKILKLCTSNLWNVCSCPKTVTD